MNLLMRFIRVLFYMLYHQLAWSYDLVADLVSLGRWVDWVMSTLPYIQGTRILELGHGPGHLQLRMLDLGLHSVGLDESRQMGRQASHRLRKKGHARHGLVRGRAQELPFPTSTFDTVIATFPAEYIFDERTLVEVHRTLDQGGRFIFLPVAWITGKSVLEGFLAWLFRITRQVPKNLDEVLEARIRPVLEKAGYQVEIQQVHAKRSTIVIVLAKRR
jgi:ubiquinone/menaquinone biosynthesis C-methylase UbiE